MALWDGTDDVIGSALSRMGFTPAVPGRAPLTPSPVTFQSFTGDYGITPALTGFTPENQAGALSGFTPDRQAGALSGLRLGPGEDPFSSSIWSTTNEDWFQSQFPTTTPAANGVGSAISGGAGAIGGFFGGNPGATVGGEWAGVEQWTPQINAAAAKYGVPVNLLKAIMRLESGGNPNSGSPQGATGLMQIMPFWNGTAGYNIYDPAQNVMLGAHILKESYDRWSAQGAANPWEEAARDYIGRGGADSFGTDQHSYWARIQQYWNELNAYGGGAQGAPTGAWGGGASTIQNIFGTGASVHDWGEFGGASSNGLYGYGTEYGLNGTQHTGIDVTMNVGTPMHAAFNGTVVCAGTGNGNGMDGCAAFNDYYGGGAGRIQIMSADGNTMLIYGHSSTSAVRPGQQVRAGDLLGTSGGMNSPHIHLEARVRNPAMPSGWQIVDPRTVLGGGTGIAGGAPQQAAASSGPLSFTQQWAQQMFGWG